MMVKRFLIKHAAHLVRPTLLWLAVLMLAVINPLACLIHCTIMHGIHQPPIEQEHYLCSLIQKNAETALHAYHSSGQSAQLHHGHVSLFQAPRHDVALIHNYIPSDEPHDPLGSLVPRAVYESLPSFGALFGFVISMLAIVANIFVKLRSRFNPPLLPPPRWA
jgi:hypothetical protein